MRLLSRSLAFAVLLTGAVLPNVSQSQVVPAIKGGGSQINVFGMYTVANVDGFDTLNYPTGKPSNPGNTLSYNNWVSAGAVGGDFRLGRFAFGQPALDARATFTGGQHDKERTYLFGPELHYAFGRLRPYGGFLIGTGTIIYNGSGSDNSIVYDLGGGLDYHLNRRVSLRAIDFQYQFWNLGSHTYPPGLLPGSPGGTYATTLHPYTFGFGVTVRLR